MGFPDYTVFPHDFPIFPQNILKILSNYQNSMAYLGIPNYQNENISNAFERAFDVIQLNLLDLYGR